ncbi:HAMP domain-containing sensor histidine kinase [Pallidibacillus thermolactis]|uniref:sensor histidine kinase n=1 Tax=Pallidibacillus thermolactis TaxID=251051 RepID=UPI002E1CDF74|nr:HAMP domain-containing sensor histidine kinase [Pallidibacillus thermolactis subsp. kokeshiiformis]
MIFIVITLVIITFIALTRLFSFKNEVRKIVRQLQLYNNRKTNKKIDITLIDQDIEHLGVEVNRLIDLYVMENRKRVLFEKEQRQAVANMSHDLRTPLTSIIGYIQIANNENLSEVEKEELLAIAFDRAKRLERLLNDFFELSVLESTDYELKLQRINLTKLLTEVLVSFYDRFQEKRLEPTIEGLENNVTIFADHSAVTRVIENLLSNTLKHADGNIMIRLEEQNGVASLMITNDALSLTEQDVQHMFDRFYMADQSRSGKSTGLGLSIVKSLMEKMNGSISSKLNDGQLSIICEWKTVKK